MLLQNSTGNLKVSGADINGQAFRKLVLEGYKFIGFVWGLNVGVSGTDVMTKDKQAILDKQNAIVHEDQTL
jgi:hypothetical protein